LQLYDDNDIENNTGSSSSSNKHSQLDQLNITDFWDKEDKVLLKLKQNSLDESLLKTFVTCGIPFAVIGHPFFIDLIKKLHPGYNLPSREKLVEIMLSHAVIRIEDKVDAIFKNATDLTLGDL